MSGQAAVDRVTTRVLLVDAGTAHDIFEVVEVGDRVARVRTAFLFEIGEQLTLRIEQAGAAKDVTAKVRRHVGTGEDKVTELDLGGR